MRLFGLIGYPLSHSFSKKYFTEKFEKEGIIDCRYELFSMATIDELKNVLEQNPALLGLNVTIPYKEKVLPYLNEENDLVKEIKACNCIKIIKGKLLGYNTDVTGFEKSFAPLLQPYHKKALVLGNGGATAAITYSLKKSGISFDIVSRKLHDRSTLTYRDIDETVIKDHLLIINTTPVGTFPDTEECPDIPYQFLSGKHYLFDLVYNPAKTLFLKKGEAKGAVIKNGYEMLVIQAEESWRIWNE
jgi:shikimate dehydrogenase